MADQCDSVWGSIRCELVAGHDSSHASRADLSLTSWANRTALDPTRVDFDWATDAPDGGGR
jgi:hypothetical protein